MTIMMMMTMIMIVVDSVIVYDADTIRMPFFTVAIDNGDKLVICLFI